MSPEQAADHRLLLVHAHPDDESIGTGATMARYAAAGAQVSLVTCTLGEEGEILVPSLAQLAADQGDQLGGWRIAELRAAMAELGVRDHRFLGGAGRFRDSGMMGVASNGKPRAFWRADSDPSVFESAVAELAAVIRELRPQVMITYDELGGYGHPDHIMAHRVAMAAAMAASEPGYPSGGEPWQIAKIYWTALPRSVAQAQLAAVREAAGVGGFLAAQATDQFGYTVADDEITTVVDAPAQAGAKARAMAAHATQIAVDGGFFALSNMIGQQLRATEYFRLADGRPAGPFDGHGRETDLFAGIGEAR